MRTSFTSKEIAHVWANEGAPVGKCPSSMSFDGDAFQSYATTIARRIRHKGKVAYVLDVASMSVTTSGHQNCVRGALRDGETVFMVHGGMNSGNRLGVYALQFTPAKLRDYYVEEYRDKDAGEPSRYAHKRAEAFLHRVNRLESAISVCEHFGLSTRALKLKSQKHSAEYARCQTVVNEYNDKRNKAREDRYAAQLARRVSSAINHAEAVLAGNGDIADIGSWNDGLLESRPDLLAAIQVLRFEKDKEAIAAWLSGKSNECKRDWPVMLRVVADSDKTLPLGGSMILETSMGARVPLGDAERSFRFCMTVRARGWKRNGEQHAVGMYQLDAVNEQGVVAGCHRVAWAEIERFAKSQGWLSAVG